MSAPPMGRVPAAWAGAVLVPVPVAELVFVSGPGLNAPRCCSAGRPETSVAVLRFAADVPEVTGCWFEVALALRPVVEGAADAGALGVTAAAGVLAAGVGVVPPPRVSGVPTPRVARSAVSRMPSLPRIRSRGLVSVDFALPCVG